MNLKNYGKRSAWDKYLFYFNFAILVVFFPCFLVLWLLVSKKPKVLVTITDKSIVLVSVSHEEFNKVQGGDVSESRAGNTVA